MTVYASQRWTVADFHVTDGEVWLPPGAIVLQHTPGDWSRPGSARPETIRAMYQEVPS